VKQLALLFNNKIDMILVTGATGQFGSKAIDHLLKKGIKSSEIAALVRDIGKADNLIDKGIELRVGDYSDYASLVKAFQGVDKLLLVSSSDRGAVENRTAHHINAIKAAREVGVKSLVYTSFVRKAGFENTAIAAFQNSHLQTEEFLMNSGIAYTILQNGIYLEMIPVFAGAKVAETGTILYPAGEGKANWVLRQELAEAAVHVLTTEGHENRTYSLTNTEAASFRDIATALSEVLGREVQYQSPSAAEFEGILKSAGVPDVYVGMFAMWATAQAQGALNLEDDTLASLLARKPTTVKEFLSKVSLTSPQQQ
jgi:NAD(P)H dehydrogenase (quinone)